MTAAENIAPTISDPLTWDEICARYPDEWVCLVEIDRVEPQNFEFRTARVIGHGKTRRVPFEQARPWRQRYKRIGHYSTIRIVPDVDSIARCFVRVDLPIAGAVPRFYACRDLTDEVVAPVTQPRSQP